MQKERGRCTEKMYKWTIFSTQALKYHCFIVFAEEKKWKKERNGGGVLGIMHAFVWWWWQEKVSIDQQHRSVMAWGMTLVHMLHIPTTNRRHNTENPGYLPHLSVIIMLFLIHVSTICTFNESPLKFAFTCVSLFVPHRVCGSSSWCLTGFHKIFITVCYTDRLHLKLASNPCIGWIVLNYSLICLDCSITRSITV